MKKITFWLGVILLGTGIASDRHNSWVLSAALLLCIILGLTLIAIFWEDK